MPSQCTQRASFTLAGILALYGSSALQISALSHTPNRRLSAARHQLIHTIQICNMARMAAVALVFASIAGAAMAQGTTCNDPTVLPGNVSSKL